MKLNVDLSLLHNAVHIMGASEIDFDLSHEAVPIQPIDAQLGDGIEVEFEDIEFKDGLASYQGRQVLLYIKDHGSRILDALQDGSKGKKFHVADCITLNEMRRKGRFERYVVTNNLNGTFSISGEDWKTGQFHEGETSLDVCKNCLKYLNYKGFQTGRNKGEIFKKFNLTDFFDTYSSFFKFMPSGIADKINKGYTDDWDEISKKIKAKFNHICQQCGLNLINNKRLLHTHHINGVKHDNHLDNLKPLCMDCHRKQPNHQHLFIKHEDTQAINHLRRVQGLTVRDNWSDVTKLADPALHGIIELLMQYQLPLPEVGYEITDNNEGNIKVELAWPVRKMGIAINEDLVKSAVNDGWQLYSMRYALSQFDTLAHSLR